ncbi:MAG: DUF2007 domain-containing protein [Acidimicrobiia bacterium]|nr:DUF2007 domain-containing protein [Acidimicrobiia bacterium]
MSAERDDRDDRYADDRLVPVALAGSRVEAETVVALLEAHGIRAFAQHRDLEAVFPTLFSQPGTPVLVRQRDAPEARALLDATPGSPPPG